MRPAGCPGRVPVQGSTPRRMGGPHPVVGSVARGHSWTAKPVFHLLCRRSNAQAIQVSDVTCHDTSRDSLWWTRAWMLGPIHKCGNTLTVARLAVPFIRSRLPSALVRQGASAQGPARTTGHPDVATTLRSQRTLPVLSSYGTPPFQTARSTARIFRCTVRRACVLFFEWSTILL